MEDRMIVTYDKGIKEGISCLLVAKLLDDTIIVVNEFFGKEADTIYGILTRKLKFQEDYKYYFKLGGLNER